MFKSQYQETILIRSRNCLHAGLAAFAIQRIAGNEPEITSPVAMNQNPSAPVGAAEFISERTAAVQTASAIKS
jgi:hypothetical protein